ncbi:gelsolin [Pseudomassariella vexata]|uniref:Gelsolin n=1 Tax=Pseudomassariella vexata TaxID=1141098 RepID=A0A1Y2E6S0_9PEZI|nr:gelsolin [Pseudomassariella vexata]ORY67232.1 gelsolin [Pseudomassariella vexata]
MAPHEGLVHMKEYDWRDSNVELIGSDIDHQVKYKSATTEPAWNDGQVGEAAGLYIWRIENFEVVPLPKEIYGQFRSGDSYIVLHSFKAGTKDGQEQLLHDIFFWLGSKTTQDEAGTAAYKTVELDEFLHGVATQHRELQHEPSEDFVALFPRISILSGGVRSGFTHVDVDEKPEEHVMLLRIFKHPSAGRADSIMVHEVEPTWQSLDDGDVFVLEKGDKIWQWQGKNCSPMEKAKAAQVVHDMTLAKHVDVEVVSQTESRSRALVNLLGGQDAEQTSFEAPRPVGSSRKADGQSRPRRLYRLSDASGQMTFDIVKDGEPTSKSDLRGEDVFLLDTGSDIWVWVGLNASKAEKSTWIKVAQMYIRQYAEAPNSAEAFAAPVSKVVQGHESPAFLRALEV